MRGAGADPARGLLYGMLGRLTMIVRELMTREPVYVRSTDRLATAIDLLNLLEIRHVPVLDERRQLIGMLSDRDVRTAMGSHLVGSSEHQARLESTVERAMSKCPSLLDDDDDVREAIDVMIERRVGAVPVTDAAGVLVGMVSYVDLLRMLRHQLDD